MRTKRNHIAVISHSTRSLGYTSKYTSNTSFGTANANIFATFSTGTGYDFVSHEMKTVTEPYDK